MQTTRRRRAHPKRVERTMSNDHDAKANGAAPLVSEADRGADAAPAKRFQIFIIDTGWNGPISKALKANLDLFRTYLDRHEIYVLDHAQSTALLKKQPAFIGHDPIVLVLDRE